MKDISATVAAIRVAGGSMVGDQRPFRNTGVVIRITSIQEELGLKLESRKFELQVMVIDHIEPPNEN